MEKDLTDLALCRMLDIKFPVIMAPMFLVSNEEMVIEATKAGITGAVPALNWRTVDELREGVRRMKREAAGPVGINLIVNASNFLMEEQLKVCCEEKVDFFITSLGNPESVIAQAHAIGAKVFCDVTDVKYAQKVTALGADALIAVNNQAGGHLGNLPPEKLIPLLKESVDIPVISAGGVGSRQEMERLAAIGADGFSVGSIFIASEESKVSDEYKQACIDYGAKDIVTTTRLSGTPCTVIRTPYVKQTGTEQNWIERFLNKRKKLKKWVKALTFYRGMQKLREAAFGATYKTVWCAGPSIEHVKSVRPVKTIVEELLG
jgi:nitronate monooxygenase